MATQTEKFEKATLISFYYVIKEGAPYAPIDRETYKEIQNNMEKNILPTKKDMIKQISDIIKFQNP